jgi:hypothetical protein
MSLPTVDVVRQAIETIQPEPVQMVYKATYLLCARIGEVIAYKYPSDKTANPTGSKLTVRTETYQVNFQSKPEWEAAFFSLLTQNRKTPNSNQIAKIKEHVAIFTVTTEKRKGGWQREIALPLNHEYEPWTKQLYVYFEQHKKDPALFPFTRQQIYPISKIAFHNLKAKIQPYELAQRDTEGNYLYTTNGNGKKKLLTKTIDAHEKEFSQHTLRKIRRGELEDRFGFTSEERKIYGGWSLGIEERYGSGYSGAWKKSFCKLLRKV